MVRNPLFLAANSTWLNALLDSKKAADRGLQGLLATVGLPTRRDQERTLHLLHQIEARLDDLSLKLEEDRAAGG